VVAGVCAVGVDEEEPPVVWPELGYCSPPSGVGSVVVGGAELELPGVEVDPPVAGVLVPEDVGPVLPLEEDGVLLPPYSG
jgi:hypothetical protein